MSGVKVTEVRDARFGAETLSGQQRETMSAAFHAEAMVKGCTFAVVLAFVRKDDGTYLVETGVSGSGPRGFGGIVRRTMVAAAESIEAAMIQQEEPK
jgi:hypothetical protein